MQYLVVSNITGYKIRNTREIMSLPTNIYHLEWVDVVSVFIINVFVHYFIFYVSKAQVSAGN